MTTELNLDNLNALIIAILLLLVFIWCVSKKIKTKTKTEGYFALKGFVLFFIMISLLSQISLYFENNNINLDTIFSSLSNFKDVFSWTKTTYIFPLFLSLFILFNKDKKYEGFHVVVLGITVVFFDFVGLGLLLFFNSIYFMDKKEEPYEEIFKSLQIWVLTVTLLFVFNVSFYFFNLSLLFTFYVHLIFDSKKARINQFHNSQLKRLFLLSLFATLLNVDQSINLIIVYLFIHLFFLVVDYNEQNKMELNIIEAYKKDEIIKNKNSRVNKVLTFSLVSCFLVLLYKLDLFVLELIFIFIFFKYNNDFLNIVISTFLYVLIFYLDINYIPKDSGSFILSDYNYFVGFHLFIFIINTCILYSISFFNEQESFNKRDFFINFVSTKYLSEDKNDFFKYLKNTFKLNEKCEIESILILANLKHFSFMKNDLKNLVFNDYKNNFNRSLFLDLGFLEEIKTNDLERLNNEYYWTSIFSQKTNLEYLLSLFYIERKNYTNMIEMHHYFDNINKENQILLPEFFSISKINKETLFFLRDKIKDLQIKNTENIDLFIIEEVFEIINEKLRV